MPGLLFKLSPVAAFSAAPSALDQVKEPRHAQADKCRKVNEELKLLSAAKDNFVASLSHEMRTVRRQTHRALWPLRRPH